MKTEYEKFYELGGPGKLPDLGSIMRREIGIKRYGFAILTKGAISLLRPHAPYVEVGAGNGYWAYEMKKRDVEVVATDPKDVGKNIYKFEKIWTPVEKLTALQALKKYPKHTMLMVWPCYNKPWAYKALKAYKGDLFVFCGEGFGGCTADDDFHDLLSKEWEKRISIWLPQWLGIHDYLDVYTRRKK
jgi:hypothetical protein